MRTSPCAEVPFELMCKVKLFEICPFGSSGVRAGELNVLVINSPYMHWWTIGCGIFGQLYH